MIMTMIVQSLDISFTQSFLTLNTQHLQMKEWTQVTRMIELTNVCEKIESEIRNICTHKEFNKASLFNLNTISCRPNHQDT